jgi:hypothetical protein
MQPLQQPIPVRFADGTTKPNGIQNYVNMDSVIDRCKCSVNFYVTKLEDKKMILGTPFLEEMNPDISWQKQTFTWRKENPLQELNCSSSRYTDINSIELNHIDLDIEINNEDDIDLNNFSVSDEIDKIISIPMEINKVTTTTQLASIKVKTKTEIPKQFRKFSKVFDEQASL